MAAVVDPQLLTAIASLLVLAGGGIAWVVRRHDARKDPLPREQAEVAVAAANVGLLNEVNLRQADDLRRQAADLADLRTRLAETDARAHDAAARAARADARADHNERQIGELQASHGQMKALFGSATGFIEELLHWVHDGMAGEMPELPANLRAFIDAAFHGPPRPRRRNPEEGSRRV